MTAKEMFEELGYEYYYYSDCIECEYNKHSLLHHKIGFDLEDKNYSIETKNEVIISKLLNKAINKQIEELGW
jgi:hypothetical protein